MRNSPRIHRDRDSVELRHYGAPRLVDEGRLIELTKDVSDVGEKDGGIPPFDHRDPIGSVGFSL